MLLPWLREQSKQWLSFLLFETYCSIWKWFQVTNDLRIHLPVGTCSWPVRELPLCLDRFLRLWICERRYGIWETPPSSCRFVLKCHRIRTLKQQHVGWRPSQCPRDLPALPSATSTTLNMAAVSGASIYKNLRTHEKGHGRERAHVFDLCHVWLQPAI